MARVLVLALGQAPNGSARSRAHGRQPAAPSCPGQGEALTVCKGTDNFRHEVRFAPTICRNRLKNMHAPARAPPACALQGSAAGCCPRPHVCSPPILQKIGKLTFLFLLESLAGGTGEKKGENRNAHDRTCHFPLK